MKKKILLSIFIITIVLCFILFYYPKIEFYHNGYLYMMSYSEDMIESEDFKELDEGLCYNESYAYNKKRDISISDWEYKKVLFFKWSKIKYQKGNVCNREYLLEESYIKRFIEKAEIINNEDNINLANLIQGKMAIVGNNRYPWNENSKYIEYKLDDKYMDMYIWKDEEGLLIIQVGLSDEGAKYIAYK